MAVCRVVFGSPALAKATVEKSLEVAASGEKLKAFRARIKLERVNPIMSMPLVKSCWQNSCRFIGATVGVVGATGSQYVVWLFAFIDRNHNATRVSWALAGGRSPVRNHVTTIPTVWQGYPAVGRHSSEYEFRSSDPPFPFPYLFRITCLSMQYMLNKNAPNAKHSLQTNPTVPPCMQRCERNLVPQEQGHEPRPV